MQIKFNFIENGLILLSLWLWHKPMKSAHSKFRQFIQFWFYSEQKVFFGDRAILLRSNDRQLRTTLNTSKVDETSLLLVDGFVSFKTANNCSLYFKIFNRQRFSIWIQILKRKEIKNVSAHILTFLFFSKVF